MAFVKATIDFKPASIGTGIKCTLRKGKVSPATIQFSISAARAAALHIANGDGVEVLIGDGEHHGLVRLRKNNSAANTKAEARGYGKSAHFLIKLGHQPAFIDRAMTGMWCQWEMVEDGWIEIVLPKWADETAPNRKQAAAPAAQPAEKRAGAGANIKTAHSNINTKPLAAQPKRNVTSNLMGDPPPGRREYLQKMGEMKP